MVILNYRMQHLQTLPVLGTSSTARAQIEPSPGLSSSRLLSPIAVPVTYPVGLNEDRTGSGSPYLS